MRNVLTNLKSQRKPPRDRALRKRKPQRQKIRNHHSKNTTRHLDDNKLAATTHFACFSLPDPGRRGIHTRTASRHDTAHQHLWNGVASCLDDTTDSDDGAAEEDDFGAAENIACPDCRQGAEEAAQVVY
jgi:hypothetical protein